MIEYFLAAWECRGDAFVLIALALVIYSLCQ